MYINRFDILSAQSSIYVSFCAPYIKIASQYEENTIYYKPEEIDIRKGTHICIYGGKFNGVKGVFMRVKGKRRRRVVVMLEGIMGISVEVHPDLIEVINDSDCDKF
ncbi:hypothetical protein PL757_06455 [Phocaeicola vulgatus]|nr:hypothetical protein [Phocaeicola vulgatus]MDB1074800.1 hypothetical protein [Phocaeicola vulgatus]